MRQEATSGAPVWYHRWVEEGGVSGACLKRPQASLVQIPPSGLGDQMPDNG